MYLAWLPSFSVLVKTDSLCRQQDKQETRSDVRYIGSTCREVRPALFVTHHSKIITWSKARIISSSTKWSLAWKLKCLENILKVVFSSFIAIPATYNLTADSLGQISSRIAFQTFVCDWNFKQYSSIASIPNWTVVFATKKEHGCKIYLARSIMYM